jgi:hypothetical protein
VFTRHEDFGLRNFARKVLFVTNRLNRTAK